MTPIASKSAVQNGSFMGNIFHGDTYSAAAMMSWKLIWKSPAYKI